MLLRWRCLLFAFFTLFVLACAPAASNRPASSALQRDALDGNAAPPGSPLIVVTDDAIDLDGVFLVDPRTIESGAKAKRIDALFARLKERRDAASEPKPNEQWLDARGGGAVAAAKALMTAAWAGYPRLHLRTPSGWADLTVSLPSPRPSTVHNRLILGLADADAVIGWQSDAACEVVPEDERVSSARLDDYLSTACSALRAGLDEAKIEFEPGAPFARVIGTLESLRRHAPGGLSFSLYARYAAPSTAPPERACGKALEPMSRVNGHLPPAEIQRVVRDNFGAMRVCYERGLQANRDLTGKVTVKFVIGRDGHVESTALVASEDAAVPTMPDAVVAECVRNAFQPLTFPKPEGGIVTVMYPLIFNPEH